MIIGLGHRAQSGKDTLADFLVAKHGFTKVAFATPLKEAARDIFLLSDEQMYGSLKEVVDPRWGRSPRDILQKLGTEGVRNVFGNSTWVNRCKFGMEPGKDYVISDVRFLNEVEAIQAWGGYVVKVDRPSLKPIERVKPTLWGRVKAFVSLKPQPKGRWVGHPSETALLDYNGWDEIVKNDGTLDDLYRRGGNTLVNLAMRESGKRMENKLFGGGGVTLDEIVGFSEQIK